MGKLRLIGGKAIPHVTTPVKINHLSAKRLPIGPTLLYHNLLIISTNLTHCLPLLKNLIGILLQLTKLGYYIQN